MSTPIDWQPGDPVTRADPYPLFARLRDEDPCHWSPRLRSWVLTRYDDVRDAIADPALSSDRMSPFFAAMPAPERARVADIERYLSRWLVFKDPPEHTRLRRIAGRVFGARALQGMRPQVERIAARLLAALPDRGQIDLVADFAGPLPCLVIMALLGVPDTELARIKRLSDDIALFIGSSRTASAKYDTAEAATREMAGFFGELIAERRRRPAGDAISALASPPPGDEALADDELVATCIMMLFAGHETTTNHIANGMLALTRFPEAMGRLRDEPRHAPAAVEELLRYDGPSGAQVRIAGAPRALHGCTMQAGDRIFLMLNAANRDPRAYPDPDRVDLDRDGPPHLTFGFGPHLCLGFALARTEGQVAFPALLARWRSIDRDGLDAPQWIDSLVFRGMTALPLRVG